MRFVSKRRNEATPPAAPPATPGALVPRPDSGQPGLPQRIQKLAEGTARFSREFTAGFNRRDLERLFDEEARQSGPEQLSPLILAGS